MTRDRLLLAAAVAAAGQAALLWLTDVPLGVPGEWAWDRIRFGPGEGAALFLGLLAAIPAAAAYAAVALFGGRRIETARPGARVAWLLGLTTAAFWWLSAIQEAAPQDPLRLGKGPLVLYFRGSSGYFALAREEGGDLRAFLSGYEARVAEGDVLHLGTHPPGLVVFHRVFIAACERSESLTRAVLATAPASVEATLGVVGDLARAEGRPLAAAELAGLWASAVVTQAVAAATVIPLFFLVRSTAPPATAWAAAGLWPLVPAVAIFLPKSDVLYPFLGTAVLALWHRPGGAGFARAAGAGAVLWLGMTLSLASLPIAALAAALTVAEVLSARRETRVMVLRRRSLEAVAAAKAFGVLTLTAWLAVGLNLPAVWLQNLRNHDGFYDVYPRTYAAWLAVNPIELALAVGVPVFATAVAGAAAGLRAGRWTPALPCLVVLGLLWLSGKNAGEAARLWLFLMPWLPWLAAEAFSDGRRRAAIFALQLLVCVATVVRVTGFDFARLAGSAG